MGHTPLLLSNSVLQTGHVRLSVAFTALAGLPSDSFVSQRARVYTGLAYQEISESGYFWSFPRCFTIPCERTDAIDRRSACKATLQAP
jgi:hypothetical protein